MEIQAIFFIFVENKNNYFLSVFCGFFRIVKPNLRENKKKNSLRLSVDWFSLNSRWTGSPRIIIR